MPADGFFVSSYATPMKADEIMTAVRIPVPAAGTGCGYAKLKRKVGDFATAAAAVMLRMKGDAVARGRDRPDQRRPDAAEGARAENALRGKTLNDASIAAAARARHERSAIPAADQRGDAEYQTAMAGEMTQRALAHGARSRRN